MTEPTPIPEHLRRRALVGLTLTYLLTFASMGIQLPFTAMAMKTAGIGPAVIGHMWAARSLTGAVSPLVWGLVADRIGGARPLLLAALAAGTAIFFGLAVEPTPTSAVVLFALYGVLANPANSLVDGMVLTALGHNASHYGRYRAAGTVGFGISAVVVSVAVERGALSSAPAVLFPVCGGLIALAFVVVALFVPSLPRPALSGWAGVGEALKNRVLVGLVVAASLLWASHAGYVSFLSPLAEAVGLPPTVGFAVFAAVVVEAIAMPLAPSVVARFSAGSVMLVCGVVAVVRWVLTPYAVTPLTFALVNGLHGITFGLFFVVVVGVIARHVPPTLRQTSQGLLSSLSLGLGGVVGGVGVGTMLEHHVDIHIIWWSMAAVAAGATMLLVPLVKRAS
jgi:PPP family 3-phenylpropionic acid transporter